MLARIICPSDKSLRPIEALDREADFIRYSQAYTKLFEQHIREWPDQWVWVHRRWKTKPSLAGQQDSSFEEQPEAVS